MLTPATVPTQPSSQWVLAVLSPGVKLPGCESDQSPPPSSAKVKSECSCTCSALWPAHVHLYLYFSSMALTL